MRSRRIKLSLPSFGIRPGLLSGYYDVPRFSENAAVGWKAGKINDR